MFIRSSRVIPLMWPFVHFCPKKSLKIRGKGEVWGYLTMKNMITSEITILMIPTELATEATNSRIIEIEEIDWT